jgi:2-iminoacetate synthase ThiH
MSELERLIRDAGRVPVQRDSLYNVMEPSDASATV